MCFYWKKKKDLKETAYTGFFPVEFIDYDENILILMHWGTVSN